MKPYANYDTISDLYPTKSDSEIGAMFGVTGNCIRWWRRRFGIPTRSTSSWPRRATCLKLDERFFSELDSEPKAYFLGFLAADGYICRTGKNVSCCVSERDRHILEDMALALGSTAPIRTKRSKKTYTGTKPQFVISFCSRRLVSDLSSFGIGLNKSTNLTYPDIPKSIERHFIRGLMDGDGWIGDRQFMLIGTSSVLEGVRSSIRSRTGCLLTLGTANGYPRLSGSRRDREALRWIYGDATVSLHRKRERYLSNWS